jgi:cation diffusion facilitator family transporter
MTDIKIDKKAEREKRLVALSSVIAAIFLTSFKLAIGLLTRSLGILSEAAHSGLDLLAAVVTFFAVRASDRPADSDHPYGHGKVENFSALIETLLLFITCGWIIYEALHRLLVQSVAVEVNYWSFVVMGLSIAIDVTRSRALMKTARKHGSQALEADALHFSTDVWSSSVVIAGLIAVTIGEAIKGSAPTAASWLMRADAVAALGVSGIVLFVSWNMGRRSVNALMDQTPKGINAEIERAVASIPGVVAVDRIRSRQSGPATFVDMTLDVARGDSLEEAHNIASAAEIAVQKILPRSDVMVHIDPAARDRGSLVERVHSVAGRQGISVHGLHIHDVRGSMSLELHAEVPDDLSVAAAHERVTALESDIKREIPELTEVTPHIEPVGDNELRSRAVQINSEELEQAVVKLPREIIGLQECHHVSVLRSGGTVSVSFHCIVAPDMPINQAHELTSRAESRLRQMFPGLGRVVVHAEPPEA